MSASAGSNVGQHLVVGMAGSELTTETRRLLQMISPAGVVLFARNVDSAEQVRALTHALKTELSPAPFIAIDQESGRVNRLRNILGEIPTVAEVKKTGNARAFGESVGERLRELGIEVNFAPVLDLDLVDADNALRERCWGRTAEEVAKWGGEFIAGLEAEGVMACPKHFPGLGGARQDSHEHLPTIERTRDQLLGEDVAAFARVLPACRAVMVGHGHYPAFDGEKPVPASLSRRIVSELLRETLGFTGMVVTDDLEMGAIASVGRAAVAALEAGADLVMVCHSEQKMLTAFEALRGSKCLSGR